MTIKEQQENQSWSKWPNELKYRQKEALQKIRETQQDTIQYYIFIQYIFHYQWSQLKAYANKFNIKIIGDMSIYVEYDSAEVWTNTHIFQLDDRTLLPSVVSGSHHLIFRNSKTFFFIQDSHQMAVVMKVKTGICLFMIGIIT